MGQSTNKVVQSRLGKNFKIVQNTLCTPKNMVYNGTHGERNA